MLAQGRQQMTAQGTSIRRRLTVRGTPHGPPLRGFKRSHRLILPPLAATVVATLALGVGVAVARGGRGRAGNGVPARRPRFGLLPDEPLVIGVRRAALEQVDLAIAALQDLAGPPDEHAVHEMRKALKRLRTVVRLLEDELGSIAYERESASLRVLADRLAGARDAQVLLETLDSLVRRHPRTLAGRRGVQRLRAELDEQRRRAGALDDPLARAQELAELHSLRAHIAAWPLRTHAPELGLLEPGLRRIYASGRSRRRRALRAGRRRRDRAMHEWRKRVKDLRYAAELLSPPSPGGAPAGKRAKRATQRLRRVAARADDLGEVLGEDHDLALLAALIRERRHGAKVGRRSRKALLRAIERRRRRLRARAERLGEPLYERKPKRFLARVRRVHAHARGSATA
jgi:CHAD domain-containing protein